MSNDTIRNLIGGICFGLFAGGFTVFLVCQFIWIANAPHTPDVARGAIYPHNEHGGILYFSAAQTLACNLVGWLVPAFILSVLISPKKNIRRKFLAAHWDNDDPHKIRETAAYVTMAVVVVVLCLGGTQLLEFLLAHGIKPTPDT